MNAKFAIALIVARITPTVRAQTAPEKRANPASSTITPATRWIQPQVVASNSRK